MVAAMELVVAVVVVVLVSVLHWMWVAVDLIRR